MIYTFRYKYDTGWVIADGHDDAVPFSKLFTHFILQNIFPWPVYSGFTLQLEFIEKSIKDIMINADQYQNHDRFKWLTVYSGMPATHRRDDNRFKILHHVHERQQTEVITLYNVKTSELQFHFFTTNTKHSASPLTNLGLQV